jgi:hypothetical protein
MESLVMRKSVDNSEKRWRTDRCTFNGLAFFFRDRWPAGPLDGKSNQWTDKSAPEGSHVFNGGPRMRNRLQVSLWGLRLDAQGIVAIGAALLIVLVFALLLAGRF